MRKRLISLCLAVAMVIAMLPITAFRASAANDAYVSVVKKCMDEYLYDTLDGTDQKKCRGMLYDLDDNGQDELILRYRYGAFSLYYEVWTIVNGEPLCVLDCVFSDNVELSLAKYNGDCYFVMEKYSKDSYDEGWQWLFYLVSDSSYQQTYDVLVRRALHDSMDKAKCYINGEMVEESNINSLMESLEHQATFSLDKDGVTFHILMQQLIGEEIPFVYGDGTSIDPYQVSTPEQLDAVRNDLGAHYIQTADIDLEGIEWDPIGYMSFDAYAENDGFAGYYNGSNYTISNMTVTQIDQENVTIGLFGFNEEGTLENIRLTNVNIHIEATKSTVQGRFNGTCPFAVGGIAGHSNGTIKNCTVDGSISLTSHIFVAEAEHEHDPNYYIPFPDVTVGGIVGEGTCTGCINYADVHGEGSGERENYWKSYNVSVTCGGITGFPGAVNGEIKYCVNYGDVYSSSDSFATSGGISGKQGSIYYCANYGKIISSSMALEAASTMGLQSNAGGIVGQTSADLSEFCVNFGDVAAKKTCKESACTAGGIAGWIGYYYSGYLENCYNMGKSIHADISHYEDPEYPERTESTTYVGSIYGVGQKLDGNPLAADSYTVDDLILTEIEVERVEGFNGIVLPREKLMPEVQKILDVIAQEIPDSSGAPSANGNVRFLRKWDSVNQIAHWGKEPPMVEGLDLGSQVTEETDTSFLSNIEYLVGTYVLAATKAREDGMIAADVLLSIVPVETKSGTITSHDGPSIGIDGVEYPIAEQVGLFFYNVGDTVTYHLYNGELVGIRDYDPDAVNPEIPDNPDAPENPDNPENPETPDDKYRMVVSPVSEQLTIEVGDTLNIACTLYKGNTPVAVWEHPQLSISHKEENDPVSYEGWKEQEAGGYVLSLRGLSAGTAYLSIYDSVSGEVVRIDVEVKPGSVEYLPIKYWDDIEEKEKTAQVKWGYSLFSEDARTVENSDPESYAELVKISALLSKTTYNFSDGGHLEQMLGQLGAKNVEIYTSEQGDISYPVHSISHAELSCENESHNIVIVTIRGTQTWGDFITDIKAWASNGQEIPKEHPGFSAAKDRIKDEVVRYISENGIVSSNAKILITGHSYGAAVANLLAKSMEDVFDQSNIYAFTFAAPNNIVVNPLTDLDLVSQGNIHNFRNAYDPIGWLPIALLPIETYTVFGKVHFFTLEEIGDESEGIVFWNNHDCTHYVNYALDLVKHTAVDSLKTRCVQIQCPVDVAVYDENGNVVGRITDNQLDESATSIMMFPVGDQKIIFLDPDDAAQLSIIATDSGTMNVIITDCDMVTGEVSATKAYSDIELKESKAFSAIVSAETQTEAIELEVVDSEGCRLAVVNEDGTETVDISEEHKHTVVVQNQKEATCTETGYSGDELCSVCETVVKQGEEIPATAHSYENGKCKFCDLEEPAGIPGDVTGDGKADYSDALLILRASIGLDTLTEDQKQIADVNADGKADYSDALLILRRSIGLE